MKIRKTVRILCCIAMICLSSTAYPHINITQNGKALSRIVLSNHDKVSQEAARLLQDFVERISGAELSIEEVKRYKK